MSAGRRSGSARRGERWITGGLWIAPLLPVLVLVLRALWLPLPDVAVVNDPAVIELHTLRALTGDQLLGPYSRLGFHHPGPAMFYALAPFYALGGQTHAALCVGSALLDAAWMLVLLVILARLTGPRAGRWAVPVLPLLVLFLEPYTLFSTWNPDVALLPLGVAAVALMAVAAGHVGLLPVAVIAGSFAVQCHVIYTVPIGLAALAAVAALAVSRRWGIAHDLAAASAAKRHVMWSVATGLVLWLAPIVEQVRGTPGNVGLILGFARGSAPAHGVWEGMGAVLRWASAPLLAPFGASISHGLPAGLEAAGVVLSSLLVVALLLAAARGWRTRSAVLWSVGCVGASMLAAGVLAVAGVRGELYPHLVRWVGVVGGVSLAALACTASSSMGLRSVWRRFESPLCAAVALPLAVFATVECARFMTLETFLESGWGHEFRANVWEPISRSLQAHGVRVPHIRLVDRRAWPEAAGVVLQRTKARQAVTVDHDFLFMFGDEFAPGREDGVLLLGTTGSMAWEVPEHDALEVVNTDGLTVRLARLATPETGVRTVNMASPRAEVYLRGGFYMGEDRGALRWSRGLQSWLAFPLQPGAGYRLVLAAAPFRVPGEVQRLAVTVNGLTVGDFEMRQPGWAEYACEVPASVVQPLSHIRLSYAYARSPHEVSGSTDQRMLAVRFRSLSLEPLP